MNVAKFMSLWVIIFTSLFIICIVVAPNGYPKWEGLIPLNGIISLIATGIYSIVDTFN